MPFVRLLHGQLLHGRAIAAAAVSLAAFPALANTTYQIKTSNYVNKDNPSCTVEVWAVFDQGLSAFAGAEFDLVGPADQGGFIGVQRVLAGPGTSDGVIGHGSDSVEGITVGQIPQWPEGPHVDFANPVLIWRGTWVTTKFTERTVGLRTISHHFDVYANDKFESVHFMGPVSEASGTIYIGACTADCDASGSVDLFDFLCFSNAFSAQGDYADCDGNGQFDVFDFLCYLNDFNAGC